MSTQDVTHKVVEAIGTIAGSSLEQTTWLRRNLEVKASPQIVVDGTNLDTDVEGVQYLLILFAKCRLYYCVLLHYAVCFTVNLQHKCFPFVKLRVEQCKINLCICAEEV